MGDRETVKWVQEQLHALVGFSDRNISEYIVSLAAKAKNVPDLLQKVIANDIPDTPETQSFCRQLFAKIPRTVASGGSKIVNKKAVSNADLIRESENYSLIDIDDRDPIVNSNQESIKKTKKRERTNEDTSKSKDKDSEKAKSKSKLKSLRTFGKDGESSEEETVIKRRDPKVVMVTNEKQLTEAEELQKKMDADIEERNAFVARMLEKEEVKTKKLAEKGLTSEQISELATRGSISSGTAQVTNL
jgi:pre-mRNA-splicing factor ATP-dependent RNA helicase DHX16